MGRLRNLSLMLVLALSTSVSAKDIHAFYADEHNTANGVGNRVLEFDIKTMKLVNTLDVPGNTGHHVDRTFHSKLYGVPKNSNFINVIKLYKDKNNKTYMEISKQIKLIHKPRSADAYNKKYDLILLSAKNRPMATLINASTDEIVGTIGEDVDCELTDGSELLAHKDANTPEGALKYQCTYHGDVGGDQISGHPYWLTPNYAAIVDRSNRKISLYHIWEENGQIKTKYVNSVKTNTSIHQIIPRDRSKLPTEEQADFYAVEEGHHGTRDKYGIPPSLLKLKLTTSGLKLVKRMPLARKETVPEAKLQYVTLRCQEIYSEYPKNTSKDNAMRYELYKELFDSLNVPSYTYEEKSVDMPIACMNANLSGGHNADFNSNFSDDANTLFVGTADGFMHIIDVREWKVLNNVNTGGAKGILSGSGHTCFAPKKALAVVTNHTANYQTIIDLKTNTRVTDVKLPFKDKNIFSAKQSHTCYVDPENKYYYNAWTDGGVFYRIDLDKLKVDKWVNTGGIPIQGNFIDLSEIENLNEANSALYSYELVNDTASATPKQKIVIDVLKNDKGEGLKVTDVTKAKCGTADLENNKVIYTAGSKECTDTFYYEAVDKYGTRKEAKITVNIASTKTTSKQVMELKFDSISVKVNQKIVWDVLKNDKGDGLVLLDTTKPKCGTATIQNNKIVYQAGARECNDEFSYGVKDKYGTKKLQKVKVYIDKPQVFANFDVAHTTQGKKVVIDVLKNDKGEGLTIAQVSKPKCGTVDIENNKIVYYSTKECSDRFYYTVQDKYGSTEKASVDVYVKRASFEIRSEKVVLNLMEKRVIDVIKNDIGHDLKLVKVAKAQCGTATMQNNKIIYQASNKKCFEFLQYTVKDKFGNVGEAKVTVKVENNREPIVLKYDYRYVLAKQKLVWDVLRNDQGEGLVLSSITKPRCGTATIQDNKIVYIAPDKACWDKFKYTAKDKYGVEKTMNLDIYVKTPPITVKDDEARMNARETITIDVLANDTGVGLKVDHFSGVKCAKKATLEDDKIVYTAGIRDCKEVLSYYVIDKYGKREKGEVTIYIRGHRD